LYRKGFSDPVHNPLPTGQNYAPAGLFRRLAAILYDSLLLFGVLMLAAVPLLAVPAGARHTPLGHLAVQVYLVAVCYLYFGWFWTHGGQTLGMKAWRVRVRRTDGAGLDWARSLGRFAGAALSWACLGLGFAWVLVDPRRRAWHDRLSGTRLEQVEETGGGAVSDRRA